MLNSQSDRYWKRWLIGAFTFSGAFVVAESCVLAQVTSDGSLSTRVTTADNRNYTIVNGEQIRVGNNLFLFHSFEEFSIPTGGSATFNNPSSIDNIIGRVTGGAISHIDGLIKANATLFLINPNGIIFGSNARLAIDGSFVASTANSLLFDNDFEFSASNPQPLLKVNLPIGLQFGTTQGSIRVNNAILEVHSGNTLALLGGEIAIEGGVLKAPSGRIELGSVAGNRVSLQQIEEGWTVGYEKVENFRDIQLSYSSNISTLGEGGGNIQVQGKNIELRDGSQISIANTGAQSSGNLTLRASDSVKIIGISPDGFNSGLVSLTTSAGDAGDITIKARNLLLKDGGAISTESSQFIGLPPATGKGGDLTIEASESVKIANVGLFSGTIGSGDGGDLSINTGQLTITDGAQVSVSSQGTGRAGNIRIKARSVALDRQSQLIAETVSGQGGNLLIQAADLLLLSNESLISTTAFGNANGGNINLDTKFIIATPPSGAKGSDIFANAQLGEGGRIQITTSGLFGIESRSPQTAFNDITASSEFGLDGVIQVSDPNIDLQKTLEKLPENLVNVSSLVNQNLCQAGRGSQFTITGRGGLPDSPNEALNAEDIWEDWRTDETSEQAINSQPRGTVTIPDTTFARQTRQSTIDNSSQEIVEAQGWLVTAKGDIVLTADPTVVTPYVGFNFLGCR